MLRPLLARLRPLRRLSTIARYAITAAIVLCAFLLHLAFAGALGGYPFLLFIPAVIIASLMFDRGSGFFATGLSAVLSLYFVIRAGGAEPLAQAGAALAMLVFLGVGLFTAAIVEALRATADNLARREVELGHLSDELSTRVKLATRGYADSEARLRALFEHTSEALFAIAVEPDGRFRIEALNPAAERATGLAGRDVAGKSLDEILADSVGPQLIAHCSAAVEAEAPVRREEVFAWPSGPRHWEMSLVPVRDSTGRIARLMGSAYDVTQRKAAEHALRDTQKMEAVGRLASGIAHDFNNLLTVVGACLERVAPELENRPELARLVATAQRSVDRGASLIAHLLAFARKQPLRVEPLDPNHVIAGLADLLRQSVGEKVTIALDLGPDAWPIETDRNQLELALLNLAINASDAMSEGGTLTISTRNERRALRNGSPGEYVALSVRDTGAGIPAEVLPRIFEPFFTTKPAGRGSGLGLAMVYGFIRQSGGDVGVDSEPGQGTVMTLLVPKGPPLAPAAAAESRTMARHGNKPALARWLSRHGAGSARSTTGS